MAVKAHHVPALAALFSVLAVMAAGCRSLEVCSDRDCGTRLSGDAAGDGGAPEMPPTSTAGGAGEASGALGGGGGAAGDGGAYHGPRLEPLVCDEDRADCDGSTLTGCEAELSWYQRHCGACGAPCLGLCQSGVCKKDELIWEGNAYQLVASTTTAFALISDQTDGDYSVLQIDVDTGKTSVLIDVADIDWQLAISADRVYVLNPSAPELRSARLDGTDLRIEPVQSTVTSIGASLSGVYYTERFEPADINDPTDNRLWFRGIGSADWEQIYAGSYAKVLGASEYGVVLEVEVEGSEELALLAVHGSETRLWSKSEWAGEDTSIAWEHASVTEAHVVVSTWSSVSQKSQLYWLGEATSHYEVSYDQSDLFYARINVFGGEVVLSADQNGLGSVQHFSASGPALTKAGIALASDVLHVDGQYVWSSIWDSAGTRRIVRNRWFDLAAP